MDSETALVPFRLQVEETPTVALLLGAHSWL